MKRIRAVPKRAEAPEYMPAAASLKDSASVFTGSFSLIARLSLAWSQMLLAQVPSKKMSDNTKSTLTRGKRSLQ